MAGRLFVLSAVSLGVLWLVQQAVPLPGPFEAFRKVVSLTTRLSAIWLAAAFVISQRRRFLWRVRRKLILSYLFLGLVPVVLFALFVLAGGFFLHLNVAGYLFRQGLDDLGNDVHLAAVASAEEIGPTLALSEVVLRRRYLGLSTRYRGLSLAVVPVAADGSPTVHAGDWRHMAPPAEVPAWVAERPFDGILTMVPPGVSPAESDAERLLLRATVPLPGRTHVVLVDLPVDTDISALIDDQTSIRMRSVAVGSQDQGALPLPGSADLAPAGAAEAEGAGWFGFFERAVLLLDFTDWQSGRTGRVAVGLDAPLGDLYRRILSAQSSELAERLPLVLSVLAVLLLTVQGVALLFGVGLGRQITSAIHELFEGTERVRQGDFTHRITVDSDDQLGALGDSFNRMSGSIEHLLHVQREKQRLDDELRIAHEIQMSLLPDHPPVIAGVSIADLCVPAREVGGDYYDFFVLGPRRFGVLVADVSGKGTSAALYMAELKGLMLALSHQEASPRRLLVRVNALLADHLDNRSFITMTYGVIDLDAGTLTHARAGHTPLLVSSNGAVEVIVPNGMVLGLRLPGAAHRFEDLLEEHVRPIRAGDVIVFYTDGVTEAMDVQGDLFGDAALGRIVNRHADLDAPAIRERVLREVAAFVGEAEPHDDMTMVIVKLEQGGAEAAPGEGHRE